MHVAASVRERPMADCFVRASPTLVSPTGCAEYSSVITRERDCQYLRADKPSLNRQCQAPLRNAAWGGIVNRCDIHGVGAG